ncbi:hypothetical protein L2E82_30435 [Cichorium intybus]|uniref:Uncharacterized protein n=1 Tax=Cichorium intybus TaxID=13427 RepID=A0ACB9D083_CICIN|nr:hypothetical protein L2E82_30435 [Cichorium intybus]
MTGDMSQLHDIANFNGGYVSFTGGEKGKITQKRIMTNGVLKFENVNFVPELKHSLLSVSQICDKGFSTHFTKKECLILKPKVVIPEEWILVRSERKSNSYIIDMNHNTLENVTCLFSKVSKQNAMLWHPRLGHANPKNLNRLAKNDLLRGLPIKDFITFEKCVACAQGKHHRKPHKPKLVNTIDSHIQLVHMDLFGLVNVLSINKSSYCLVIIDDYSRFTWVFFLKNKSETEELVKRFIILIENQTNQKVKGIRCDNGTEFKNAVLDQLCADKGVQRQYSVACTPQQNGVAERRNRTLIDAACTLLCDSKLPVTKRIVESFDVRWLEENETDARVGPDWLFNYVELFKYFNVFSDDVSGTQPGPTGVNRDEDVEVIADPIIPSVIFDDPILNDGASPVSITVTYDAPAESSRVVDKTPVIEESTTQEGAINSESADIFNSTLMDSLFPERIPDEYVVSTTHDFRNSEGGVSAACRVENITNLPVSSAMLEHAIPSRIQRDHPIEKVIGSLEDGVRTRSQSGHVNECLYSCFISQTEPKNVEMALNEPS